VARAYERLRTLDAFLIVNGRRHFALDRPVITIGRRMDNDVIVDSPVVSRQHAHIRWRYGRFVLYDAGSRGGVAVNGEPCTECVLQPGDLITLSGRVNLIYGEGLDSRESLPAGESGPQETLTLSRDDLP
jgi:pSer/pThr/pTyr-binding forkhead associated (FHA) protein